MAIIKYPIITEKTVAAAEALNKYTFEVDLAANKPEAVKEIETMYKVKVTGVTVHNRAGKTFTFGKYRKQIGRKTDRKFMIFTLKKGDKIDDYQL